MEKVNRAVSVVCCLLSLLLAALWAQVFRCQEVGNLSRDADILLWPIIVSYPIWHFSSVWLGVVLMTKIWFPHPLWWVIILSTWGIGAIMKLAGFMCFMAPYC